MQSVLFAGRRRLLFCTALGGLAGRYLHDAPSVCFIRTALVPVMDISIVNHCQWFCELHTVYIQVRFCFPLSVNRSTYPKFSQSDQALFLMNVMTCIQSVVATGLFVICEEPAVLPDVNCMWLFLGSCGIRERGARASMISVPDFEYRLKNFVSAPTQHSSCLRIIISNPIGLFIAWIRCCHGRIRG